MASPIAETWMHATVRIRNEWGQGGSGFLVARSLDVDQAKIFLVTNKHVLNPRPELREAATYLDLDINIDKNGTVVGETVRYALRDASGSKLWKEHRDNDVDVLAVDVTALWLSRKDLKHKWVSKDFFARAQQIADEDITAGEDVVVVGYPIGVRQGATNYPVIRQGIIATRIGEEFVEDVKLPSGKSGTRRIRGFLVDGATIPGSSGSPVVLKPVTSRLVKGNINLSVAPAFLLGMIAETRFAPVNLPRGGSIPIFAGLGLAFDAETIYETIELFFS